MNHFGENIGLVWNSWSSCSTFEQNAWLNFPA